MRQNGGWDWIGSGKGALAMFLLLLMLLASAGRAENLLVDPSFEQPKPRDNWGAFKEWSMWVAEPPARMEASTLAHGGQYSCLLVSDVKAVIRLLSKEHKLPAGRYRAQAVLRGLDISKGQWNSSIAISVGFDGKFRELKKDGQQVLGNFGWSPMSYVFDVPEGKAVRLIVALSGGWLWVDDCVLEKVGNDVPLTADPVMGNEEAPIAAPAGLGADAPHCPACYYRHPAGAKQCWACGQPLNTGGARQGPAVKPVADFEGGASIAPFKEQGKYVTENAPQGKGAMAISGGYASILDPQDWSQYDVMRFEAFNPGDKPVIIGIQIHDAQTKGDYWKWVNHSSVCLPGKSTISFNTDMFVGEKARPGRPLLRDQIVKFALIVPKNETVIFDNFRLERVDTTAAQFPGLVALDFGMLDSPVMPGFTSVLQATQYSPQRGMGWSKQVFWRAFNCLQPDALYQDFICPISGAVFRYDLPNGKYHVMVNLDSPNGFWGETQTHTMRQLTANGKVVVDEKQDFDSYLKKYFRNARKEDLPGVNTFDEYVETMFQEKEFDVDVTDGKLELSFKGEYWSNCLSALILYPADKAAEGRKFVQWTTDRRRTQFDEYFRQIQPKRSAPPTEEYALFTRRLNMPVNAFDGPVDASEKIGPEGLELMVAPDQEEPISLVVQPKGDLGKIDLAISAMTGAAGTLDPGTFVPGWIDYRINRVQMDGSVYSVAPRYWHATPAPAAPGVTRRFWIRTRPAADAKPGTYKGTITLKPEKGQPRTVPLTVRVLPFKLDPITDVAVGPYSSEISTRWPATDPKVGQWDQKMFEKILEALRSAGCTSFTGRPHLKVTAKNGQITLDTSIADKEMAMIRAKGFTQLICSYGVMMPGYQNYGMSGPDAPAAKAAGFADFDSFLKALYTAVDEHAVKNNWLPVAWNLCDEPLPPAIPNVTANALAHRKLLPGLKRTTFVGETSLTQKTDAKGQLLPLEQDVHAPLIKALPIASLNLHDEAAVKLVKDSGTQLSFYNGASRWTYGRYMKFLVDKHQMMFRPSWHLHAAAGDPYYALDCREDDYCWFNTDESGHLVPSMHLLTEIQAGLNDYRYFCTLQRLIKEKSAHPAAEAGRKLLAELLDLKAGPDRTKGTPQMMDADRAALTAAIEAMLK